jgi:glycosyltransferase involved in cell wall biosynthesis
MSIMVLIWLLPVVMAAGLLLLATRNAPFLKSRICGECAAGLLIASLPFIIVTPFTIYTQAFLIMLQLFAVLLAGRIIFGRLDKLFAHPSTRVNTTAYIGIVLLVVAAWWLGTHFPGLLGNYDWRIVTLLSTILVAALIFTAQLLWAAKHYKITVDPPHRKLHDLPTVSVCIPARNEDHALEDCLNTVLASSYPKLEVIVLDDCSQDKTSDTIRSFAHDGVRFIKGDTPASGWLGKNQAMQTLAEHASGDYILFMDVDTRLSVTSIAQLIDYTLDNKMNMIAVLPQNRLGVQAGGLFGTLHDFWQIVLPLSRRRIAVARQAWLINADRLRELGGFKSVAQKIVPEISFARRLFAKDSYRFIAGNEALGITTAKRWSSELESAVRLLYPTYKRQPGLALLAMGAVASFALAPLGICVYMVLTRQWNGLHAFAAIVALLVFAVFGFVTKRTHPRSWFLRTLLLPVIAVQEVFLILTSLVQYEFGEVNWKGRNVCYPVISSGRTRLGRSATSLRR